MITKEDFSFLLHGVLRINRYKISLGAEKIKNPKIIKLLEGLTPGGVYIATNIKVKALKDLNLIMDELNADPLTGLRKGLK